MEETFSRGMKGEVTFGLPLSSSHGDDGEGLERRPHFVPFLAFPPLKTSIRAHHKSGNT